MPLNYEKIFSKENVIPWSIVAFDSKKRTPQQRVEMVANLGFSSYAHGGKKEHFEVFPEEITYARNRNIDIHATWLYITPWDQPDRLRPQAKLIFDAIEQQQLKTQIWVGFSPKVFEGLDDESAFAKAKLFLANIAQRAKELNCSIALYNHGGWYGNPENQVKLIESLPNYEIGIVFNFHHAHDHLDNFESNIDLVLPYLWCVNLNGMKKDGPKIITIGQGDLEKGMISYILHKGYQGPFGILGHVKGGDAQVLLEQNYQGLIDLFR